MDRYQNRLRSSDGEGVKYYTSVLPRSFELEEVPFIYVARDGDRLDNLAYAFYNSAQLWWVIARANKLSNGSIAVPAGTRLYIPTI